MSPWSVDVLLPVSRDRAHLDRAMASVERVAREAGERLELEVHVVDARDGRPPGVARNEAAARGRAPYLALLDDDDLWLPGRLLAALEILERRPDVALVCGEATLRSGGTFLPPTWRSGGARGHRDLALYGGVAASTVTLRRACWERAGGMDDRRRAEDFHLWLRLTAEGRPLWVLPTALAELDDVGPGLSRDPAAMARATLEALDDASRFGDSDPAMADRRARLRASVAHGVDDPMEQAILAASAVAVAPGTLHGWTALGKAAVGAAKGLPGAGRVAQWAKGWGRG